MPRLSVGGGFGERPVPIANDGHIIGMNGYPTAKRGAPYWINVEISDLGDCRSLTLEAEFKYEPSEKHPNEARQFSRVGIWTSVKDSPVMVSQVVSRSDEYEHGEQSSFTVRLNEWQFGQKSEITFNVNSKNGVEKLQLALCSIPFFNVTNSGLSRCQLDLRLHAKKYGEMQGGSPEKQVIEFRVDENTRPSDEKDLLELMNEFGAFNLDGDGNSVHPKQLYTSRMLNEQLQKTNHDDIEIAYIGTDTTENLRSLLRVLIEDEISQRIKKFTVYFTKDWDESLLRLFPKLRLDQEVSKGKFEFIQEALPLDGTLPSSIQPVDFVISTYVTPWVLGDEKNKSQYSKLVNGLLNKKGAKLISVDPTESNKIVRSYFDGNFNCDDMYIQQLHLRPIDEFSDIELSNNVVTTTVWTRRDSDE